MALFSKIQKFLSHVTYLAQGLRLGGCKLISLFHFIDDKTGARICSVNCQGLNGMLSKMLSKLLR